MTREKATRIVNVFFNDMNPALWNGEGNKPESFDERPWQYEIVDGINLEITFAYDEEDGWHHYCALVYAKDNNSFDLISGYGIDSKLNVIDTVMDICRVFKQDKTEISYSIEIELVL